MEIGEKDRRKDLKIGEKDRRKGLEVSVIDYALVA